MNDNFSRSTRMGAQETSSSQDLANAMRDELVRLEVKLRELEDNAEVRRGELTRLRQVIYALEAEPDNTQPSGDRDRHVRKHAVQALLEITGTTDPPITRLVAEQYLDSYPSYVLELVAQVRSRF